MDTGASAHIICNRSFMQKFDHDFKPGTVFIELADGVSRNDLVKGRGIARIPLIDSNGEKRDIILRNALYIPSFNRNIISLYEAVHDGMQFHFNHPGSEIMTTNQGYTFSIKTTGHLYSLQYIHCNALVTRTPENWHRIMGHCNMQDIKNLPSVVDNMKISGKPPQEPCEICNTSKKRLTHNRTPDYRPSKPFEYVQVDLKGPLNEENDAGFNYVFGAICEFSGYVALYMMKTKADTPEALKQFIADHSIYGKIKKLRSDNGTEFKSHKFNDILYEKSIKHEYSSEYSPHQCGHIERTWETIFGMTRSLMQESKVPMDLYPYAIKTAAYIRNRCYNSRIEMTPFQAVTGNKPNMAKLHLFGSKCYGYNMQNKKTFDKKAITSVFIGYDDLSPSYILYEPNTNQVWKSRCVTFSDTLFYSKNEDKQLERPACPTNKLPDNTQENSNNDDSVSEDDHSPTRHRFPVRNRQVTQRYGVASDLDCESLDVVSSVNAVNEIPNTYRQALNDPEKDNWIKAMQQEVESLKANDTYTLCKKPKGTNTIGGRWVYSRKTTPDGLKYKARWVAKGFTQRAGLDYTETYAPTARMTSLRMLISIAAQNNFIVRQFDCNNAYLNSEVDEELYMIQPEGFEEDPSLVCKLKKSIYGLKQSARNWNSTLVTFMKTQNLTQSKCDPCVFFRNTDTEDTLYVLVWVDDVIGCGSNMNVMNTFKHNFSEKFKIKDLGTIDNFLGIQFKVSEDGISLNQSVYVQNILNRFNMNEANPRAVPCDPSIHQLMKNDSEEIEDKTVYRELIGSLIYLMCGTRPDISFIVNLLSQYMSKPKYVHLKIAKGVLRYLKKTIDYELNYTRHSTPLQIIGYSDSDFANSSDRHSVSGFCFKLNPTSAVISWNTRKQKLIADSTCESEYIALSEATKEAIFLRMLFAELTGTMEQTVTIFGDNKGSICLAQNACYHKRTKHIDIKYHMVRDYYSLKYINIIHIASEDNLADIFTKPLPAPKLNNFATIRGIDLNARGDIRL